MAVEDAEEVHGRAVDPGVEARAERHGVLHVARPPRHRQGPERHRPRLRRGRGKLRHGRRERRLLQLLRLGVCFVFRFLAVAVPI